MRNAVTVDAVRVAAFDGQIGQAAFSSSKGRIVPIARDLASYAIRVVTIAPGLFDTPLLGLCPKRLALRWEPKFHIRAAPATRRNTVHWRHIVTNPMLNDEAITRDGAIRMAPR